MSESKITSEIETTPHSRILGTQVVLQVGDKRFMTTRQTLVDESPFFSSLLSGRWGGVQAGEPVFIDADGELFEYILRYLRRGVLPIFYDKAKGHNHALYLALLEEAKYFQIARLENWIKNQTYLQAVKIMRSASDLEGLNLIPETTGTDVEVEYHPTWTSRKVYICPRGIGGQRGIPSACGRQCRNAQGEEGYVFEDEEVLRTLVIRKRTIFDQKICMEER